ncbi:MAG: VOC family protein [Planctomycetia bacterium]|nr:VOC family protein [Planctomycetia bacterium]
MENVLLNLVVLCSPDIERSRAFYEALGLRFQLERHGSGPEHYACELGKTVLEIYPRTLGQAVAPCTRFGFSVASIEEVVVRLARMNIYPVAEPRASLWGRRAVLQDPDGHRVELLEPREVENEPAP